MTETAYTTVGGYLATRIHQAGIEEYFAIPGDYNLLLLDELLKSSGLQPRYCCNELNAGYAADGYARAKGLAAAFVTYSVGGLSIINAAAGAQRVGRETRTQ
jgi:indolepyruvate decarboxylase